MLNRRGETLVEVVVSFGILALVFSGTAVMSSSLVGLIMSSRSTTKAVALSQKQLVEGLNIVSNSCAFESGTVGSDNVTQELVPSAVTSDGIFTYRVTLENLDPVEENPSANLTSAAGFRKVVSRVEWNDKGVGNRIYSISQVVKK